MPIASSRSRESLEFISEKLTGILFTGVMPFALFIGILKVVPLRIGFTAGQTIRFWYLILILVLITALITFLSSKSRIIQEKSPELRLRRWFPRHLILSVSGWFFYIFGYELFFRGILWFSCYDAFGFWPSLLVNLLLYSSVHLPKGRLMTIGSLPVGMILCLLSYLTGSFIPAFIIHLSMAVMTELFSLYHNPEFQLCFTM